jgi:hypothetical protein
MGLWPERRRGTTRSSELNVLFRGLRAIGAGASIVAGVLTGIGALAEVGAKHPDLLWIFLPAGFLVASVLFAVVGTIGAHLTRPVTEAHASTLRGTASLLIESLRRGGACNYDTNGHLPKEAFHAHYPKLGKRLDEWDELRGNRQAAERHLHDEVRALAGHHGVDSPPYNSDEIITHVRRWISHDLQTGTTPNWGTLEWAGFRSQPDTPGPAMGVVTPIPNQSWISLPPHEGESDEEWNERARAAHEPVDAFFASAQTLPEFETTAALIERTLAFGDSELPQIIDDLKRVLELETPARKRKCPTC